MQRYLVHSSGDAVDWSRRRLAEMKHAIYEHPVTHKFALLRLPARFRDGDKLPIPPGNRWFETREQAVAALSELLDEEE